MIIRNILTGTPTEKKEGIRTKINEYMKRAEELKKKVEEEKEGKTLNVSTLRLIMFIKL